MQGSTVKTVLYLDGSPYDAAVALETNAGVSRLLYISRDHLGSITHITDAGKALQAEYRYDAWGRMCNPVTLAVYAIGAEPALLLNRGYTGHEHLKEFGLINMNARLYDALVGRMISPDNYVQDPLDPRNYNRYAYAVNNPLSYVDQDGNFFWIPIIIGAVIGAYTGAKIADARGAQGFLEWAAYIGGGALIGGVSGWAGGAVGAYIGQSLSFAGGGLVGMAAGGAVAGGISGGGFAGLAGGNIGEGTWKGALTGFVSGAGSAYIGGALGALAGGALGGALGTALAGGDGSAMLEGALIGAAISWGGYEISQSIAYRNYKNSSQEFGELTRIQFDKISLAAQRSFARGKEYGGWILDNGDIEMWTGKATSRSSTPSPRPKNAIAEFHTHPRIGGKSVESHSEVDKQAAKVTSYVVGRQNIYRYYSGLGLRFSPLIIYKTLDFNVYSYNLFWLKRRF